MTATTSPAQQRRAEGIAAKAYALGLEVTVEEVGTYVPMIEVLVTSTEAAGHLQILVTEGIGSQPRTRVSVYRYYGHGGRARRLRVRDIALYLRMMAGKY